jgi:pilus assembly protein CpaF
MKIWYNSIIDNTRSFAEMSHDRIRIGRHPDNDLVLASPFVAEEAAILSRRNGAWELVALGVGEIVIGDKELYGGDRCELIGNQEIRIFPFTLSLDLPQASGDAAGQRVRRLDEELSKQIQKSHVSLLDYLGRDFAGIDAAALTSEQVLAVEHRIELLVKSSPLVTSSELLVHTAGCCLRGELLARLSTSGGSATPSILGNTQWTRMLSAVPDREDELTAILADLEKLLGLSEEGTLGGKINRVQREFWNSWKLVHRSLHPEIVHYLALRHLKKDIKDIVFGYGPLEDLIRLPTVSEIMVVDSDHIYVEKEGRLESSGRRFISDEVTTAIIDRIVSRIGRRIDKSSPLVDARLSDGSRVNAVIPPLAVSGPCLTIRKFPARRLIIDDLVKRGALTRSVAEFLRACVLNRRNILVSGGTGTGKTTLLNCLSDFIPGQERVITVEDTAELQLNKEHVVRLETKEANIEGTGKYSIRDLVRNALRMRPDRIVVGECRGAEALDMLQAMNTGHDGSLTTIHANNSSDVILRLEVLVQMAADLPVASIRQQVVAAIDLIVQLERMRDGRRCVSQITEVVELDPGTGLIRTKDIFAMDVPHESTGKLVPTGHLPTFMHELMAQDLIDLDTFYL